MNKKSTTGIDNELPKSWVTAKNSQKTIKQLLSELPKSWVEAFTSKKKAA